MRLMLYGALNTNWNTHVFPGAYAFRFLSDPLARMFWQQGNFSDRLGPVRLAATRILATLIEDFPEFDDTVEIITTASDLMTRIDQLRLAENRRQHGENIPSKAEETHWQHLQSLALIRPFRIGQPSMYPEGRYSQVKKFAQKKQREINPVNTGKHGADCLNLAEIIAEIQSGLER